MYSMYICTVEKCKSQKMSMHDFCVNIIWYIKIIIVNAIYQPKFEGNKNKTYIYVHTYICIKVL